MRSYIKARARRSAGIVCTLSVTALLLSTGTVLYAQDAVMPDQPSKLKGWSIGIRGLHLYDLPSYRNDTELSRDLQGLTGDKTQVDIGLEGYLEKQFTPLLGVQAGYRWGQMTGANDVEYYKNSFYTVYGDMLFHLSNIDKRRGTRRWGLYTKAGLGWGHFEADRYLISDDSRNGNAEDDFWTCRLGGGFQYRITNYLRVELDATYNMVYHDGFDGYNNATGNNPYLSTGLGVAYTFGKSRNKPMYGVNFFDPEYFGAPQAPVIIAPATDDALRAEQAALKGQVAELRQQIAVLQQQLNAIPEPPEATPVPPVSVYFNVSSAYLTREAKKTLTDALIGAAAPALTVTAYADNTGKESFNQRLKEKRADAVKRFITETLGYGGTITVRIEETQQVTRDNFLSRKAVISFE